MTLFVCLTGCASLAPDSRDSSEDNAGDKNRAPDQQSSASPVGASPDEEGFTENPAVVHLLDRAEQAVSRDELSLAEALADRALRIQRTAARGYLILATVQLDNGNLRRASDLARQGLLYTPENSMMESKLLDILGVE